MGTWPFEDAKNKFSELVNAALAGEPQRVTLPDQSSVVVLPAEEYNRLRQLEESHIPGFSGLLLEIPQDDHEFDQPNITPRALDD